jgi:ABC-type dipeptide/oligopeptide/nickel transport system ATPase component
LSASVREAAAESAAALEIRDLHTYFFTAAGVVRALSGVDLRLESGRMLGLVGESGAGKTTLAHSIMRVVPPPGRVVKGETKLYGRDLQRLQESELRQVRGKEIAMIVPNPRAELNPLLTIGEQLANVARAHLRLEKGAARERAVEILSHVRIPDPKRRANAYPHELSGGMAQRVVIAMAMIGEPKVTISDDATSGLDVTVQAQVLDLTLSLLRERRSASLMITRDLGIVANYCDHVAVLFRGRLLEAADVRSFFANPRHPYSIELVSAFSYAGPARASTAAAVPYDDEELELREVAPGHLVRDVG